MKILISFFICIASSAAHSAGTNSSLFESKVVGGEQLGHHGNLPYMVTILYNMRELDYPSYAMGSFYDGKHVIIASINAEAIKGNMSNFIVQGGERVSCEMFEIVDVRYKTNENNEITSKYGIIELAKRADIGSSDPIQLLDISEYMMQSVLELISGGWGSITTIIHGFKSLLFLTLTHSDCRLLYGNAYNVPRDEVCIISRSKGGEHFENHEYGAPLYHKDEYLVGIVIYPALVAEEASIVLLLADKVNEINELAGIRGKTDNVDSIAPASPSSTTSSKSSSGSSTLKKLKSLKLYDWSLESSGSSPSKSPTLSSPSRAAKIRKSLSMPKPFPKSPSWSESSTSQAKKKLSKMFSFKSDRS